MMMMIAFITINIGLLPLIKKASGASNSSLADKDL